MRPSPTAELERADANPWVGAAGRGPSPVDLVHLSRQTFGDKRLETELLRLFLRQAEDIGKALGDTGRPSHPEQGPAASDCELVHMLSGSARAVGAVRVATLASAAESVLRGEAAASSRLSSAARVALRDAIDEARMFIAEVLDQA